MSLLHLQQPVPYGCMYHAAYALTGDRRLLEHVHDISRERFLINLAEHGWFTVTYHVTWVSYTQVDEQWWRDADFLRQGDMRRLLCTIDSTRMPGFTHMIAVAIEGDRVTVSDSRHDGLLIMTFAEFAASRHARAYEVEGLFRLDLAMYPVDDAREHQVVQETMAREAAARSASLAGEPL